jgi:hypothetical protein
MPASKIMVIRLLALGFFRKRAIPSNSFRADSKNITILVHIGKMGRPTYLPCHGENAARTALVIQIKSAGYGKSRRELSKNWPI